MGAVYEAEDLDTGRRVALKVLGHALDSPQARQRFFREGRLAASINHANSVYVFGTEEVGGTPVIAMELVAGGTLHERVAAQGPLPFAEAVDSVLQVISGLEAAQRLGVLHRDVKPSNCFIDTYGTVKIGDFGLSLSTAIRADASITASGVYLGTPAFSSPEQLRGEELTVRSDIYAVGVTLYYLLTGRMPFEAPNIVQLLATVLERRPESPARIRPGIPNELGQVILKCLNKDPGERYPNYSELRDALLPFSSIMPTPASLPLRFLAGLADTVLIGMIGLLLSIVFLGGLFPFVQVGVPVYKMFLLFAGSMAAMLAYYGLLEGLYGASLGKAIFRLRVAGPDRNVPGIPKALLRALIFILFPVLPYWIYLGFNPLETMARSSQFTQIGMSLTFYLLLGLLFSTARRRNGWAGLHDLVSNTRVIRKPKYQARPSPAETEQTATVPPAAALVGPYHVLQTIETRESEQWLAGYDTRLLRKVLLHIVPPGSPAVATQLRNLARPGRFRWITGRRTSTENWDAYENPGGQPLLQLLDRPQPWSQVRFWISDIASELALAETDGTVPDTLAVNRVWITAQGFAKLMDFPAPGAPPTAEPSGPSPGAGQPNNFLREIAVSALAGDTTPSAITNPKAPLIPLPLHARRFIDQLPQLNSAASVLSQCTAFVAKSFHRHPNAPDRPRLRVSGFPSHERCRGGVRNANAHPDSTGPSGLVTSYSTPPASQRAEDAMAKT